MTQPQDVRTTLQQFATHIAKWRVEADKLRRRAGSHQTASKTVLLRVEDTSGELYREIESVNAIVGEVARQSPQAAGELAEVGEILRLLLLDITELGIALYSTRSGNVARSSVD